MKIWIVWSGAYSAQSVEAAFTSRDSADRYVRACHNDSDIWLADEPYEVDDADQIALADALNNRGQTAWSVQRGRAWSTAPIAERVEVFPQYQRAYVWAATKDDAIRIGTERIAASMLRKVTP